jgi:hypothetical protein
MTQLLDCLRPASHIAGQTRNKKFSDAIRFHADQSGLFADICRKHDRGAFFAVKDEIEQT